MSGVTISFSVGLPCRVPVAFLSPPCRVPVAWRLPSRLFCNPKQTLHARGITALITEAEAAAP